jgi:hypothetical protein
MSTPDSRKPRTQLPKVGRPRINFSVGDSHALLWGAFKKSVRGKKSWRKIPDINREKFFRALASIAMLPDDSPNVRGPLAFAYGISADLTLEVLPTLRRAAQKITCATYKTAIGSVSAEEKLTKGQRDLNSKLQRARGEFVVRSKRIRRHSMT